MIVLNELGMPVAPNILDEAKQADLKSRVEKFSTELKKIMAEYQIGIRAQIMADGPIMNLIDTKNESAKQ